MTKLYRGYLIEIFNYDDIKSYRILKIIDESIKVVDVHYRYGNEYSNSKIEALCINLIDDLLDESCTESDYNSKPSPLL